MDFTELTSAFSAELDKLIVGNLPEAATIEFFNRERIDLASAAARGDVDRVAEASGYLAASVKALAERVGEPSGTFAAFAASAARLDAALAAARREAARVDARRRQDVADATAGARDRLASGKAGR